MPDTLDEALASSDLITDPTNTIIINNDLRTMTIPANFVFGVYNDKDTHRIYFVMPKSYGEFDLTQFDIRINYQNANFEGDKYIVKDPEVHGDSIKFSWLVGRNAYVASGTVRFAVCLIKTDGSGNVQNEFNTTVASASVLPGYETTDEIIDETEQQDLYSALNATAKAAKESEEKAAASANSAKESEESVTEATGALNSKLTKHIDDKVVHIENDERETWNKKVAANYDKDSETVTFSP